MSKTKGEAYYKTENLLVNELIYITKFRYIYQALNDDI